MGFACFSAHEDPAVAAHSAQQEQLISRLKAELAAAKKHNSQLSDDMQGLQTERARLLQFQEELLARPIPLPKADAATEMPMVTVAVMAKPPVEMESRIPQPTGEDTAADGAPEPSPSKSPGKSRIPAHPSDNTSSGKGLPAPATPAAEQAGTEPAVACSSPQVQTSSPDLAAISVASGATAEQAGATPEQPQQRPDLLLQNQLKVAEAFKQSLEAQLRDARFANSNLQTQVLCLQTKLEKAVQEQVDELERLTRQRRDAREARDTAARAAQQLKQQLADALADKQEAEQQCDATARRLTGVQQEADASSKALQQASEELAAVREQLARHDYAGLLQELQGMQQGLQEAEARVEQLEAAAQRAANQHCQAISKAEHELQLQTTLYDATAAELLNLTSAHGQLRQDFQRIQLDADHKDGVERLVLREMQAQLSRHRDGGTAAADDEGNGDAASAEAGTTQEEAGGASNDVAGGDEHCEVEPGVEDAGARSEAGTDTGEAGLSLVTSDS